MKTPFEYFLTAQLSAATRSYQAGPKCTEAALRRFQKHQRQPNGRHAQHQSPTPPIDFTTRHFEAQKDRISLAV